MGFKDELRRLKRAAQRDMVVVKLRDGGTQVFNDQEVFKDMFLTQYALMGGEARLSNVLAAVRQATPESRAAFEAEYGPIEMETYIIAPAYDGGWVKVHRLLEDGTVESICHEGGSEEAQRIRLEVQQRGGPGAA